MSETRERTDQIFFSGGWLKMPGDSDAESFAEKRSGWVGRICGDFFRRRLARVSGWSPEGIQMEG